MQNNHLELRINEIFSFKKDTLKFEIAVKTEMKKNQIVNFSAYGDSFSRKTF